MAGAAVRKGSLLVGSLAVVAMGAVTVACSPRTEEPADTPSGTSVAVPAPTEKQVRTNVTKSPILEPPQKPSTNCSDPKNSINCVITGGPAAGEVVPN